MCLCEWVCVHKERWKEKTSKREGIDMKNKKETSQLAGYQDIMNEILMGRCGKVSNCDALKFFYNEIEQKKDKREDTVENIYAFLMPLKKETNKQYLRLGEVS